MPRVEVIQLTPVWDAGNSKCGTGKIFGSLVRVLGFDWPDLGMLKYSDIDNSHELLKIVYTLKNKGA